MLLDHFLMVAFDLANASAPYVLPQQGEHHVLSSFLIAAEKLQVLLQKIIIDQVLALAPPQSS